MSYPRLLALSACAPLVFWSLGCDGGKGGSAVTETSACKVVKQHLKADAIEKRFGKASEVQDFFGDKVVVYRSDGGDWSFQVGARTGAFRALHQPRGKTEQILPCPQ